MVTCWVAYPQVQRLVAGRWALHLLLLSTWVSPLCGRYLRGLPFQSLLDSRLNQPSLSLSVRAGREHTCYRIPNPPQEVFLRYLEKRRDSAPLHVISRLEQCRHNIYIYGHAHPYLQHKNSRDPFTFTSTLDSPMLQWPAPPGVAAVIYDWNANLRIGDLRPSRIVGHPNKDFHEV